MPFTSESLSVSGASFRAERGEPPFAFPPPAGTRSLEKSGRPWVKAILRATCLVAAGLAAGLFLSTPPWPELETDSLSGLYERAAKLQPDTLILFLDGSPPVHTAVLEFGEEEFVGRGATPEEALLAALAEVGPQPGRVR